MSNTRRTKIVPIGYNSVSTLYTSVPHHSLPFVCSLFQSPSRGQAASTLAN